MAGYVGEEILLKPNVLWAQRKEMILLRVKMEPSQKPDFEIHETYMDFKGLGVGASGKNWYGFQLVFYDSIETKRCRVRFLDHEVEVRLQKKNAGSWPRLQSDQVKPHWLKLDFEHFEVSESEEDEEEEEERQELPPEMKAIEKEMMKSVDTYRAIVNVAETIKTAYLVLYNVIQWIGFTVLTVILLYLLKDGKAGITRAYEMGFPVISVFQSLAVLEIVNNMLGLVKGGMLASVMQVSGRMFILFICLEPIESIHGHPVVYALFLVYALIEIVRYPFYVMSTLNKDIPWLSWLRYSMWIPLYPIGFVCEGITVWLSLQQGPPGGVWSYPLPNPINMSISVAGLQKILLVAGPLYFYLLYSHMAGQRRRKLSGKPKKD